MVHLSCWLKAPSLEPVTWEGYYCKSTQWEVKTLRYQKHWKPDNKHLSQKPSHIPSFINLILFNTKTYYVLMFFSSLKLNHFENIRLSFWNICDCDVFSVITASEMLQIKKDFKNQRLLISLCPAALLISDYDISFYLLEKN